MRLFALYTLFNGVDQLNRSLRTIIPHLDGIIFGVQQISNTGNPIDKIDVDEINKVRHTFSAHIVNYETDLSLNPKENERRKHQAMINEARDRGATHFVLLAGDHIYKRSEFKSAKEYVRIYPSIDVSLTKMYTYFKHPTWQLDPPEEYYMPFICKIYADTRVVAENNYPVIVDPSVRVKPANTFYQFNESEIMLHHFSMVRKDIISKFRNAAAAQNWPNKIAEFIGEYNDYDIKKNSGIQYFKERKIKIVPNYFEL